MVLLSQLIHSLVRQGLCLTLPWHDLKSFKQNFLHCTYGRKITNRQVNNITHRHKGIHYKQVGIFMKSSSYIQYICVPLCHAHVPAPDSHVFCPYEKVANHETKRLFSSRQQGNLGCRSLSWNICTTSLAISLTTRGVNNNIQILTLNKKLLVNNDNSVITKYKHYHSLQISLSAWSDNFISTLSP